MLHGVSGPCSGFVRVAGSAGIGDPVAVRHGWRDESKRMRVHEAVGNALRFDRWHVAGNALTSSASGLVVRVFFQRGSARPVRRQGSVTIEAQRARGLSELRVVISTMHVVAVETGDAATIHDTLNVVVSLHSILVGRAIREVIEIGLPSAMDSSCQ